MVIETFGPGVAPAVSVVDGLVYLAYGAPDDTLQLVVWKPDGTLVRRNAITHGFGDSWPVFSGPWLAFKQDASQGYAAAALNVLTGQRFSFTGAADGNYGIAISEALAVVAYQRQTPDGFHVWFGSLVDGSSGQTALMGAPDGLDTIESGRWVTLRKDTRLSVAGMSYPVRGGDLTVGEDPAAGIAVRLNGDPTLRLALSGTCDTPDCASDGTTYALCTWGNPGGVRLWVGTRAELQALPLASAAAPPPAPIVAIGRPLWFGWFEWETPKEPVPHNCELRVGGARADVIAEDGTVLAQYASGGTADALEAVILAEEKARPGVPVLGLLDEGTAEIVTVPTDDRTPGFEFYRGVNESVADFEARGRRECNRNPSLAIWIVPQCYDSNANNTKDLASIPPIVNRVARDCPNVIGILIFHDTGRSDNGLVGHPALRSLWADVFAGITGTPPKASPPPPPVPVPKPRPPVTPELPSLDAFIHGEFPQLVAQFKKNHPELGEPGNEWAAFQSYRRFGPERWTLAKMLEEV